MLTITYGTRGELIKLATLIIELRRRKINFVLVDSNQQDTSEITAALGLPEPDFRLPQAPRARWSESSGTRMLNVPGLGSYGLVASLFSLKWVQETVSEFKSIFARTGGPVLFVGNTMSVYATIKAAKSCNLKLISYEAGLRTGVDDRLLDWPYMLGDKSSDLLFARSSNAEKNLVNDGVKGEICLIENPVVDTVNFARRFVRIKKPHKNYILANSVRSIQSKRDMKNYADALMECDKRIIFAPSASLMRRLEASGFLKILMDANIEIMHPTNYVDYVSLLSHSALAITDSNGVEEECSVLRKHCIVTNSFVQYPELENEVTMTTGCDKLKMLNAVEKCFGKKSKSIWKSGGTSQAVKVIAGFIK